MGNTCLKEEKHFFKNEVARNTLKAKKNTAVQNQLNINKLPVELGKLVYCNLPNEKSVHGDYETALEVMEGDKEKPLLVVFAEWPGCSGSKDGGKIFADKSIMKAVNDDKLFNAVAFNTWDRYKSEYETPFVEWGGAERGSDWGHLKIIDPNDKKTILAGTGKIYGFKHLKEVKNVMCQGLKSMGIAIPKYLE